MKLNLAILSLASFAVATPQVPIQPSEPLPGPSDPVPVPPGPPQPTITGGPAGPVCECGYTYCASVLLAMKKPWNTKQLSEQYCNTPNVACADGAPATNVSSALYICLCDKIEQKLGNKLNLLCGCDDCQIIPPDYRGRCKTPCYGTKYGGDDGPVLLDQW